MTFQSGGPPEGTTRRNLHGADHGLGRWGESDGPGWPTAACAAPKRSSRRRWRTAKAQQTTLPGEDVAGQIVDLDDRLKRIERQIREAFLSSAGRDHRVPSRHGPHTRSGVRRGCLRPVGLRRRQPPRLCGRAHARPRDSGPATCTGPSATVAVCEGCSVCPRRRALSARGPTGTSTSRSPVRAASAVRPSSP